MNAGPVPPEFIRAMGPVARELLGEPNAALSSVNELRFGSHGSISVRLDTGVYYNHEGNGEGGGVVDLVQKCRKLDKSGAIAWLRQRGHLSPAGKRIVATYDYRDEGDVLLFQVVRYDPKDFRQRRPDGSGWSWKTAGVRRVVYRLPNITSAVAACRTIYVVEGEKAAEALVRIGLDATCSPGGAGKWKGEYSEAFRGADVVLLPDNDQPGREHAESVRLALQSVAASVRVLELPGLPAKGDVADWVTAGGTWQKLEALVEGLPEALQEPRSPAGQETSPGDETPAFCTEDALALQFSDRHSHQLRHIAVWGKWLEWTGTHWRHDPTLATFDRARLICRQASAACGEPRIAAKVASAATVAAVERLARADRRHAATVEQWDTDSWLLNTPGGTVDLRTGKMRAHSAADHLTKITAVAPGGDCPRWLAFLGRATGGDTELQGFLRRMAGYCLTGSIREHALFFAHGTGANGKGVTINTMTGIMGDYATVASIETFTTRGCYALRGEID